VKSISLKVTIWSVAALAISLAVFLLIGANVIGKSTTENFTHANQQLFRYALTVYHADGKEGLARYMQELNQPGETHYSICNASGHDLESGEDHSELIKVSVGKERPYRGEHNQLTMGLRSDEGNYIWLATSIGPSTILFTPFYVLLLVTVVALYWLVTAHLPLEIAPNPVPLELKYGIVRPKAERRGIRL
jgi:hypothetical protein